MNARLYLRWAALSLSVALALVGSLVGQAAIPDQDGGFKADDGAANSANQSGRAPALAFGSQTPGGQPTPWLAFAENNQVVAAHFSGGSWQRRGTALNFAPGNSAGKPSFGFSGTSQTVPWAAFVETIGGVQQILAARFVGASWQRVGGGSPPALNHNPAQSADNPALAASGTLTSTDSTPWVAWDEATASGRRVFVKRLLGSAWQAVGAELRFDAQRNSSQPDISFSGAGNATAWAVWQEQGGSAASRIFAARTAADGASSWSVVGSEASCTGLCLRAQLRPQQQRDQRADRLGHAARRGRGEPMGRLYRGGRWRQPGLCRAAGANRAGSLYPGGQPPARPPARQPQRRH